MRTAVFILPLQFADQDRKATIEARPNEMYIK